MSFLESIEKAEAQAKEDQEKNVDAKRFASQLSEQRRTADAAERSANSAESSRTAAWVSAVAAIVAIVVALIALYRSW